MLNDLLPNIARMFTKDEDFLAPFGRDGSTIQMGVWAGGHLESDISTMNFDSMTVPDYLPGPLWVDEKGQRFQNEAFAGPEINGFFMARAKRGNITSIYDSTYETQILRGFPGHQAFEYDMPAVVEAMKGNFEAARNAGAEGANGWYCADTIEQLAEYIGVEPAALTATVEQYNKVCAEGYDSDFAKDPRFLNAVAKAPFYAHVTTPSLGFALVTTGGFVTTNAQHPCCRTACTADQKASPFHAPSFSTAFTGQIRRQLPQCRQWAASILRGASGLMQPTGQPLLVHTVEWISFCKMLRISNVVLVCLHGKRSGDFCGSIIRASLFHGKYALSGGLVSRRKP